MQPIIARRIMNWQRDRPAPPWELMVCPTYRCNLKCGICARSWQGPAHPDLLAELPDERWLHLVDEGAELGVRYLNIGGGGEPMLRRELVMAMCEKAKRHGMEGHLQTNGGKLTDNDLEALIDAAWDHVTISLDGPTAKINDAIRFKNAFEEAVKCIDTLNALKKRRKASRPIVQINMVATALNFDKLDAMTAFCVAHGVEFLSAVPLLEYSPHMTAFILTEEQRAEAPGHVNRAMAKADAAGLKHNLENLLPTIDVSQDPGSADAAHSARTWPKGHMATTRCLEPWRGLVVASSGHALPCCFFWNEQADNLRNKSLRDVWFGPYLTEFREHMRDGQLPAPCVACKFPDSRIHRQLKYCLEQEAAAEPAHAASWPAFITKAWRSLRSNGIRGSMARYRAWRAIQRGLHKEQ